MDVTNELARLAGLHVEYRFARPWEETENLVLEGHAYLIPFRAIHRTTQQHFLFTQTLDTAPISHTARTSDHATTGPIPGTKVGVINRSSAHELLKEKNGFIALPYRSMEHLFMDLLTGQIDLIMTPPESLLQLARGAGLSEKVRVIAPPAFEILRAIALRPGDEVLRDRFNRAIDLFEGTAEQKQIYERWIGMPEPWWTVKKVSLVSGTGCALLPVSLLAWRHVEMQRLNTRLDAERVFLQTMIDAIPEPVFLRIVKVFTLVVMSSAPGASSGFRKEASLVKPTWTSFPIELSPNLSARTTGRHWPSVHPSEKTNGSLSQMDRPCLWRLSESPFVTRPER